MLPAFREGWQSLSPYLQHDWLNPHMQSVTLPYVWPLFVNQGGEALKGQRRSQRWVSWQSYAHGRMRESLYEKMRGYHTCDVPAFSKDMQSWMAEKLVHKGAL